MKCSESLQDGYRRRLRALMCPCKTCGHPSGNLRELSELLGLRGGPSTLWRFLSGKDGSGRTLDKIDAYLRKVKP